MRERRTLRLVVVISVAMAVLLPAYNILFLNPSITKVLASEIESDALRISVHLSRERPALFDPASRDAVTEEFLSDLNAAKHEFELYQVNIYSSNGELISPTMQDPRFLEQWQWSAFRLMGLKGPQVSAGEYTAADGEKYLTDVTIPIINSGKFEGAFQFFFDTTDFKKRADTLIWSSSIFLLVMDFGLLALMLGTAWRAGRAFKETGQAQEALQLSERKFSQAFNDSPDWVLLSRLRDGTIVEANSTFIKAKGLQYGQVIGKTAQELGIWKSEGQRQEVLRYLERRGSVRNVELYPYVAEGSEPAMLLSADIIEVKDERFILKVLRDVTDLRRAEQKELDLLRELRIIFDNIPVGIAYLDRDMRFISANRFFIDFVGMKEHELIGKPCQEVILQVAGDDGSSSSPGVVEYLCGFETIDESFDFDSPMVVERRTGDIFSRLTLVPERAADGSMNRLVFLLEDISEQKRAEEEILNSLDEKDVLLKEIHHRVKNNLQVISSLLSLQSRGLADESLLAIFRESQARVKSMALIHESLYQSEDLSLVDAQRYLQRLGTYLFQAYGIDPGKIRLALDAGDVRLGVDLAVPCGLIVNELLTNSLKYAFPGGTGEVRVSLRHTGDAYRLIVKDNGIGYSDIESGRRSESLGFRLIDTLVSQLDGTMKTRLDSGLEVVIDFSTPRRKVET